MTLRFISSLQYPVTGWTLDASTARTAGVGQNGFAGFYSTAGTDGDAEYAFAAATEVIWGFCFKHSSVFDSGHFFELRDAASIGGTADLSFVAGPAGEIIVYRANETIELGRTATGVLQNSTESYIEIRALASATVGEVEIHLNGDPTPALNLTGQNTNTTSWSHITMVGNPSGQRVFSMPYFIEVDATVPNDFLGHIRAGVLAVNANGNSSQWVGSDGNSTDNYLLVDDPPLTHDSDTTHVLSATVGERDTYGAENMPTTPLSIVVVQTVLAAKKTDAGSRAIKAVIRSGGTNYLGATAHFLSTTYLPYTELWLQNPNTAAAWTESGVNGAEYGIEVTT